MKQTLLFLIVCLNWFGSVSQTFEVVPIKYSGDIDKRINLVILGDGYQASELPQFEADANNFTNAMFAQSPFAEYENYFNVYIIKVISNESGATHPGTAPDEPTGSSTVPISVVDNYFDTAYDSYNVHRLLYTFNNSAIVNVLAANFPQYDQALILVNAPYYGGSGGTFPIASTDASSTEIAIHELGHSFVDLKDEYYPGDAQVGEAINMTQDNNPTSIKWKNWLGSNNVGIFSYGTSGTASTWYRPHQTCKMRYLGYPFCSVCKEGIVEKIHSLISPIDSYLPTSNTVDNPTFPLDFQLNLIQTSPNTLVTEWTLNGTVYSNALESISIIETDLIEGINNLNAIVTDNTPLLRVDGHDSFHVYTVTWVIDNSTLGIDSIDDETNSIAIDVFPNPTENMVNVKIDSRLQKEFTLILNSIDGKLLKSIQTNYNETTAIDIHELSSGLYILNILQNGNLIGQKKIVKQ